MGLSTDAESAAESGDRHTPKITAPERGLFLFKLFFVLGVDNLTAHWYIV